MAWIVNDTMLQMAEGDFGIELPFAVTGTTLAASDSIRFTFTDAPNGTVILTKEYTNISQNTANLELSAAESALFKVGTYYYDMDWYQAGNFQCNLIPNGIFKVVDKACV